MIPGIASKLTSATVPSAAVINVKTDVIYLTGVAVNLSTLMPNFGGGFSGQVMLIAVNNIITIVTGGNIATGGTLNTNTGIPFTYCKSRGMWFIQ